MALALRDIACAPVNHGSEPKMYCCPRPCCYGVSMRSGMIAVVRDLNSVGAAKKVRQRILRSGNPVGHEMCCFRPDNVIGLREWKS
jgi:hypothetical protein